MPRLKRQLSRVQKTQACLNEIATRPDFPAFAAHIQEVMCSAADEDHSLRYITNVILRDYSLTLKVLRTANSSFYNRSGRAIHSVTHAIALLGLDSIRQLAGGLALFEHFRQVSPGLRELMLLSLLTASHAGQTAERVGYARREEAYLCGMFRNLGELLVACYFSRDYAAILARMSERRVTERQASLHVLGFTFEDLGQAVARYWNMPEGVTRCMAPPAGLRAADPLDLIAGFSHGLTNAVYRRGPDNAHLRVKLLLEDYGRTLGLVEEDVREITQRAIGETQEAFAAVKVPVNDLRLRKQMESALTTLARSPAQASSETVTSDEELLEKLVAEVEELAAAAEEPDLNHVILAVLEAILRGGRFDRVAFCLVNPEHSEIHGRIGLGEGVDELLEKFRFPLSLRGGPIAAALLRKIDLVADSEREGRYEEFLKSVGAASFGLFPLVVDRVVVGCLYFDRTSAQAPPDDDTRRLLVKLRDLCAAAIRRKRAAR